MSLIKKLPGNLALRTVDDDADRRRFADFNSVCNNPSEGATCVSLLNHHPETTNDDYWLIEDETTGEVVSTTCLIPWKCRFAGLELKVAQLEMVLTHPDYRGQGLVRAQVQNFHTQILKRQYDLGIIWGIPYFYRQFGYSYAIDGNVFETLPVWKIPDRSSGTGLLCRLHPANMKDLPYLEKSYTEGIQSLDFCVMRDMKYWEYLLQSAQHPISIIENIQSNIPLGYAVANLSPERATILESYLDGAEAAWAFLRLLKTLVRGEIQIAWPKTALLAKLLRSLGSSTIPESQWLLRLPDVRAFLLKIKPILESRLAASPWRGLSADLILNLYRYALKLRLYEGLLTGIDSLGFIDSSMGADGGHLCIPPEAFIRLLFGYRTLSELADAWPDIVVKPETRNLVEALFPAMRSYLYTPYHSMGQGGLQELSL